MTHTWPARGVAAALGTTLAVAAAPAIAAWDCTDSFGNRYLVAGRFGESADVHCTQRDEPAPAPSAEPGPKSEFESAPAKPEPGRGRLVLAAPLSAGSWLQVAARRRQVDPLIEVTAREFGLDADLLRAVVEIESHFDPGAVSPRGAIGLMQVMPSTAAALGLARPQQSLLEPQTNLRTGARELQRLSLQFAGAIELVLAAYNAGENSVLRNGFAVPPYPETQAYVRDVLAVYSALQASR